MARQCGSCKTAVTADAVVCPSCGALLAAWESPSGSTATSSAPVDTTSPAPTSSASSIEDVLAEARRTLGTPVSTPDELAPDPTERAINTPYDTAVPSDADPLPEPVSPPRPPEPTSRSLSASERLDAITDQYRRRLEGDSAPAERTTADAETESQRSQLMTTLVNQIDGRQHLLNLLLARTTMLTPTVSSENDVDANQTALLRPRRSFTRRDAERSPERQRQPRPTVLDEREPFPWLQSRPDQPVAPSEPLSPRASLRRKDRDRPYRRPVPDVFSNQRKKPSLPFPWNVIVTVVIFLFILGDNIGDLFSLLFGVIIIAAIVSGVILFAVPESREIASEKFDELIDHFDAWNSRPRQ